MGVVMVFIKGHKTNLGRKRSKKECIAIRNGKIGFNNPNWNGGIRKHMDGYVFELHPQHPNCNSKGYIFQHRIVLEKYLGIYLNKKECTHHINGIKDDNRIKNLMLFKNHSAHVTYHNNKNLCPKHWILFDGSKLC